MMASFDRPSHLFDMQHPVGYEADTLCNAGHTVTYKHEQTGQTFSPLTINGHLACVQCLVVTVGLVCVRPHRTFEIAEVSDA